MTDTENKVPDRWIITVVRNTDTGPVSHAYTTNEISDLHTFLEFGPTTANILEVHVVTHYKRIGDVPTS